MYRYCHMKNKGLVQVQTRSGPKVQFTHHLDLDLQIWVRSTLARTLRPTMGSVWFKPRSVRARTKPLVFKSPVRSGFFPFLAETATATGFLILKKSKNRTGTEKDRSIPVLISSTTGLNRFSLNRTVTGLSRSKPVFFFFFHIIL